MNALKVIKKAIEQELKVNIKDCTVIYQGTNMGFDKYHNITAAVIHINSSINDYKIRVWGCGVTRCERVKNNETAKEAYIEMLNLI